ncbi:MAG TPA: TonB family protein [Pyrinomonadaceae bacterium]|nr:TonB family protein [Pyrinomonadaceae bacterium]
MKTQRINFRASLALLMLCGLCSVVAAQSPEWETLRPEKEVFSVSMPKGSTVETGKELYHKMELNTRYYISTAPGSPVFAIASFSGIPPNSPQYTEMQRLNSYVDAFKTLFPPKLKGKVTPVKLTLVGAKNLQGNAGREYRMTIGDMTGIVHTFATRRRFYAVAYLSDKKNDEIQEQFLSSFVLPEAAAPAPTVATTQPPAPRSGVREVPDGSATPNGSDGTVPTAAAKTPDGKPGEPNAAANKPKSISGGVLNGKATSLPKPDYPIEAQNAGITGTVAVQVTVDEAGNVIEARAVSGHPLLQQPSVIAAQLAKFAPTSLMGDPVKVTGVIMYNFAKQ